MTLTEEQKRLIEAKRQEALRKRAEIEKQRAAQLQYQNKPKQPINNVNYNNSAKPTQSSNPINSGFCSKTIGYNNQNNSQGLISATNGSVSSTTINKSNYFTSVSSSSNSASSFSVGISQQTLLQKTSNAQTNREGQKISSQVKDQSGSKSPISPGKPYQKVTQPAQPAPPIRIPVKFMLKTKDKFELCFPFNSTLVEIIRKIPSASFDAITKNWNFELVQYKTLLLTLSKLKQTHNIELELSQGIPEFVLQALIKESKRVKPNIELSSVLPQRLHDTLYTFQKEGIQFAINREGRCLIADDMGLGKTIQALATAWYFRKDWPLLIVCPSSLRFQWKRSAGEWLDDIRENVDIDVIVDGRKTIPVNKIVIISYDLLTRVSPGNAKNPFGMIILDESHFIKNDAAQRTKAALKLIKSSKRVLLLTGTPALSRPMELFTQLQAVDSKNFARKHDFGMRYCDGQLKAWGYDYRGSSNSRELQILLESTVMIRRMKVDVLQELPEKRRTIVTLDINLPPKAKQLMTSFRSRMNVNSLDNITSNEEQRSLLFQWYSSSAEVKSEPVCRYVNELVEQDKKFICFAHHKVMMDAIANTLEELRCSYIRIDGSTPSDCRQECCDYFQTKDRCKVALIGITSAGMGITLTAAQLVVFAELYYNPGVLTQAEDRAHRIGQKDSVLIQYLFAPNTVDEHIWPLIQKKFKVLNNVGLTKDNFNEADEAKKASCQASMMDKFVRKVSKDIQMRSSEDGTKSSDESQQMTEDDVLLTDDEEFKFDDDDDDLILDDFNLKLNDSYTNINKKTDDQLDDSIALDDPDLLLNDNDFMSEDED